MRIITEKQGIAIRQGISKIRLEVYGNYGRTKILIPENALDKAFDLLKKSARFSRKKSK